MKYYTYNGETHTLHEWANITGINYSTLYMRIQNGMSIEEALTPSLFSKGAKAKTYTHNGETHTLHEWAGITGINYFTLYTRIKNGKSLEKAISEPGKNQFAF